MGGERLSKKTTIFALVGFVLIAVLVPVGIYFGAKGRAANSIRVSIATAKRMGLPTSSSEIAAWHPTVPREKNAAIIYEELLRLKGKNPPGELQRLASQSPNKLRDQAIVAELAKEDTAFQLIKKASEMPDARFAQTWNKGIARQLNEAEWLSWGSRALYWDILLRSRTRSRLEALHEIRPLLSLARHSAQEMSMIGVFRASAIQQQALAAIQHFMDEPLTKEDRAAFKELSEMADLKINLKVVWWTEHLLWDWLFTHWESSLSGEFAPLRLDMIREQNRAEFWQGALELVPVLGEEDINVAIQKVQEMLAQRKKEGAVNTVAIRWQLDSFEGTCMVVSQSKALQSILESVSKGTERLPKPPTKMVEDEKNVTIYYLRPGEEDRHGRISGRDANRGLRIPKG